MADLIMRDRNHGWHDGRRLAPSSCPFAPNVHHRLSAIPLLHPPRQEERDLFAEHKISKV